MGKIYFLTQAYNAEKTLARCVDSVLDQTEYGDRIEYWFCENGSTDRTREMIDEYAKKDPRIKVFYNEKNHVWNEQSSVFWDFPKLLNDDDYFCWLDSDDYYDTDFLKKTLPFMLENKLDIAIVGSDFFDEKTGQITNKRMTPTIIMDTPEKFDKRFPRYHEFTRTIWGKLFSGRVVKYMITMNNCQPELWKNVSVYSTDTYMVYSVLKHCSRMGILSGTLHKYQMSKGSLSYVWKKGRFECDQIVNDTTEEFLRKFGPISKSNRDFLDIVYANALSDSLKVLFSAKNVTAEEKLSELRKAVDYRVTINMMSNSDQHISNVRQNIFNAVLSFGQELKQENGDLKAALKLVCPKCAPYISAADIGLYVQDNSLKNALSEDNIEMLVEQLLCLASKSAYSKQYDLFKMIDRFSENRGLAAEITDPKFIKKHSDIFLLIWKKEYAEALDKMTEIVLNDKSIDENFCQTYITLAAVLESVDEFLIGKIKLAVCYCRQNRFEECRAVLAELEEMGIQDNDDLLEVRAKLNGK